MSDLISKTKKEQESFKCLCDFISEQLDTAKGKEIVSKTIKRLQIVIKDIHQIVNEQNVKEMLVIHTATLPIFDALFGERARLNPMTLVFNMAINEINEMLEGNKA
jgi:predicted helicase